MLLKMEMIFLPLSAQPKQEPHSEMRIVAPVVLRPHRPLQARAKYELLSVLPTIKINKRLSLILEHLPRYCQSQLFQSQAAEHQSDSP